MTTLVITRRRRSQRRWPLYVALYGMLLTVGAIIGCAMFLAYIYTTGVSLGTFMLIGLLGLFGMSQWTVGTLGRRQVRR